MDWWLNLSFVDLDNLIPVARAAEKAGFTGVSLGDHLVYPKHMESDYPYSSDGGTRWSPQTNWPDAWVAIAAMAASTRTLRFTTGVYVAPLRHPVNLAKALSTAARLSGGRVMAGLGAGWMKEEFDLLGAQFETRGGRFDEVLAIVRLLLSGEMVSFAGKHFSIPEVQMSPAPGAPVPLLIGGLTDVALRRAVRNDGWIGVHKNFDETQALVAKVKAMLEGRAADSPFELMMNILRASRDDAERFESMGVDSVVLPLLGIVRGASLEHQLEAIERVGHELALQQPY